MRHTILIGLLFLPLVGCGVEDTKKHINNAQEAQDNANGDHKITLYLDGNHIREFRSRGFPVNGGNSCYFRDKTTEKYIRVAGTIVIEEL